MIETIEIFNQAIEQYKKDFPENTLCNTSDLAKKQFIDDCKGKENKPNFASQALIYARYLIVEVESINQTLNGGNETKWIKKLYRN